MGLSTEIPEIPEIPVISNQNPNFVVMLEVDSRILESNKGVVFCFSYWGGGSYEIIYQTSDNEEKLLITDIENEKYQINSTLYAHVDDKANTLLILSDEPFPY